MNIKLKPALLLILISVLGGCGTSNAPITADADNVARAKVMRDLYTKSNGNYDSLSSAEKTQFQKVISPSVPVEKAWAAMAPQAPRGSTEPRQQGN